MRSKSTIYSVLVIFLLVIVSSCSSKKEITEAENSAEVKSVPCSDYNSDEKYYRANQSGESPKLSMAKKQALLNAKSQLAGNIQSKIRSVQQQYTNQKKWESKESKKEFEQEMQELTRNVVDQKLKNVNPVCEKLYDNNEENSYQYFVAIEMPTDEVLKKINKGLSKEQKLQLEYDKEKFKEVYNKEMKELEEKREE